MAELRDAFLAGYVRTPFGRADPRRGVFRQVRSDDLAVVALRALLERTGVPAETVDGIMLGRLAYQNPYVLAEVDRRFFGAAGPIASRRQIVESFLPYVEAELARGTPLARISRHMLGLFHGEPGGRVYRRILSEEAHRPGATLDVIRRALAATERPAILQAAE